MVNLNLFSNAEIQMQAEPLVAITLCGNTEIYTPTVTQTLLQMSEEKPRSSPWSHKEEAEFRKNHYITILGATSIYRPLLAREYMDLRNLLASGAIELSDFQVLWMQEAPRPFRKSFWALTLLGTCQHQVPANKEEMKELDRLMKANALQPGEYEYLRELINEDRTVALNGLPGACGRFLSGASTPGG